MSRNGNIEWAFGELLAFGSLLLEGTPVRFSGQAHSASRTPPRLGEHTDEIFREVGYATGEITALRNAGAIA